MELAGTAAREYRFNTHCKGTGGPEHCNRAPQDETYPVIEYTEALYSVITRRKATGVLKDCLAGLGTGEKAGSYGGYETTING